MKRAGSFIFLFVCYATAAYFLCAGVRCYGQSTQPTTQPAADYTKFERIVGVTIKFLDGTEQTINKDAYYVQATWAKSGPQTWVATAAQDALLATMVPAGVNLADPIFVSSQRGLDANDGKTADKPKRAISQALFHAGVTVLEERGGTYDVKTNIGIPAGATLTWFGLPAAPLPINRYTAPSNLSNVAFTLNGPGAKVDGIHVIGVTATHAAFAITSANCSVLNSAAEGVDYGFNVRNATNATVRGNVLPVVQGYGLYAAIVNGLVFEGNNFAGSVGQTTVRMHQWSDVTIRGNLLARPNPGTYQGSILRLHNGGNAVVEDNDFKGGHLAHYAPIAFGPLAGNDGGKMMNIYKVGALGVPVLDANGKKIVDPALVAAKDAVMRQATTNIVFRGNRCDDVSLHVFPGMTGLTIDHNAFAAARDNIVNYYDDPAYAPVYRAYPTITVINNTATTITASKLLATGVAKVTSSGNTLNGKPAQ